MKRLTLALAVLVLAIQYPLWLGKGGWLRVWDLQRQLDQAQAQNGELRARNLETGAEIGSLRQDSEAMEERARRELHMMRGGETFFQFRSAATPAGTAAGQMASSDPHQLGVE